VTIPAGEETIKIKRNKTKLKIKKIIKIIKNKKIKIKDVKIGNSA